MLDNKSFTFQYGVTITELEALEIKVTSTFTFQYGVTITYICSS